MPSQEDSTAPQASDQAAPSRSGPIASPVSPGFSASVRNELGRRPNSGRRSRRGFLLSLVTTPFALGWTLFTVTIGASLLAMIRFLFPNLLVEAPGRFQVGPPSDYPPGTVSAKWKSSHGIWIVHSDAYKGRDEIYALVAECTHLGCTPLWQEMEQKFKCPCHGSGFYVSGVNFEGPAPRPLERCAIRLAADGNLEVDKNKRFRQELGQWDLPESYVDGSVA